MLELLEDSNYNSMLARADGAFHVARTPYVETTYRTHPLPSLVEAWQSGAEQPGDGKITQDHDNALSVRNWP